MNKIIYKYDIIKSNKLIFGKDQKYENNTYIPIFFKENNKINNFNVKTCKLYIPNKMNQQSKYFLSLQLAIPDEEKDFKNFILRLEKCIKNKFKKQFKKKKYVSILKENNIYINLNINNNNFIDINYEKIDKLKINTPTNGYFVINIKNIWYNENKWGINLYLYSALILPSQINNSNNLEINEIKDIFKKELKEKNNDDKNINDEKIKDNEKFFKFFKLKAMKVPITAIKNKMMLNNLDSSIIDYDCNTLTKDILKKNKNINSNMNKTINNKDLLSNKNKLKKTEIIEKKKVKNKNLKIPSLEEIQNQIKKMKNKK